MCNKEKHPHDEVIRAYLDGKIVQVKCSNYGSWEDILHHSMRLHLPTFSKEFAYRIKPETAKYRVAMFKDPKGVYFYLAQSGCDERVQMIQGFVRWVTDWVEVAE